MNWLKWYPVFTFLGTFGLNTMAQTPSTGSIQQFPHFESIYLVPRNNDVWLPDGYDKTKKYPVIYMQDGQNLFDVSTSRFKKEWKVDETLQELINNKEIPPCIVVGIWSTEHRFREYFPENVWLGFDPYIQNVLEEEGRGEPLANKYLKFLVEELKPFIDKNFSTLPDRKNTFICGSSMGALISFYAICMYPEVFGGAACLSTNWPGTIRFPGDEIPNGFAAYFGNHLPASNAHRIYFDLGNQTLDSLYPPSQRKMDSVMRENGWHAVNWSTRFFAGAAHTETDWAARFKEPAVFLLNPKRYRRSH